LEEIVVFGSRNPQKVARELQKIAPNIVNIQSQQEIEKYPDVSTAEALSRIPGVSLETDTGEGRFVNIRGLDADLNGTTFGGVTLPASSPASPFGGGRAVAFDAIPAGFVGTIAVTKSLTPEMDANGLGGQIEITPKQPRPGEAPFAEGQLGSGVEPLRNTPIVQGDLTVGGSFGLDSGPWDEGADKPFSILATGDTYQDQRGIDDVEETYSDGQSSGVPDKTFSDLQLRRYLYHRQRYGYGGELDFRPNDTTSLYFRYAESGYTEDQDKQFLVYKGLDNGNRSGLSGAAGFVDPANPNAFIATGATVQTTTTDAVETLRNRVESFGGVTHFDNGMVLDYRGSYADGSYHQVQNFGAKFKSAPVTVLYNNITDPTHPFAEVLTPGFNVTNPASYALSSLNNSSQENTDAEWAGVANLAIPLDLMDGNGTFKFGGSARLRDKSVDQQNQIFDVSGLPAYTLANFDFGGTKTTYYDGRYTLPNQPNLKQIAALFSQYPKLVSEDVGSDLGAFERDSENVYAGYLQYTWSRGPWGVIGGIRFEQTDAVYRAYTQTTDKSGNTLFALQDHPASYFDYFPTLQGRYEVEPDLIARLAYSTAIARPGFDQVSGATQVDLNAGTVSSGNPKLKPTTVDNFDASVEWYLPDAGILSVGLFDKEFHNYIFTRTIFGSYPGIAGAAMFTNYVNAGSGQAYGAEFNYHQKFDFLPEFLDGFGVDLNYTYVDSSAEIRPGETEPLPSTAQHTANAALFYENHGLELRVAVDYVGQNLFGIGSNRATDVFSRPRALLDVSTQYQFDDHFKVYLNAKNLTNTTLEFVEGGSANRPIQREFYDITIQSGIKFQFGGAVRAEAAAEPAYVPPPAQAPVSAPRSYLVFFDFNKSDLTPQAVDIVDAAAKNAGAAKVTQMTVTGHTDTVGSDAYNMRLSRRRAESVAARLEKDGIPASEIAIVAKGKRDLLVPTKDGVKEPQNRRVQIVYDGGATS
jgi:TonB-dependent receptor